MPWKAAVEDVDVRGGDGGGFAMQLLEKSIPTSFVLGFRGLKMGLLIRILKLFAHQPPNYPTSTFCMSGFLV